MTTLLLIFAALCSGLFFMLYGRKRRFPDYQRVAEEVRRNERKLTQYYIAES